MDSEVELRGQPGEQLRPLARVPEQRRIVRTDEESSLITPFTVLPRRLADSTFAQIAWNLLLFSAVPTGLFAYWIYVNGTSAVPPDLAGVRLALPLAGVWVLATPVLMYWGEHAGARWVGAMANDSEPGWNVQRVRGWKKRVDRLYYPTALLGAAGAMVVIAAAPPRVRGLIPLPDGWYWTAVSLLVFGYFGFIAMGGLNGVIRWVVVVAAAVTGTELRWHPLRPVGRPVVAGCYRISLMFGVFLSCGALFVPALLLVVPELSLAAQAVIWVFITLLLVGGFLIFTIPIATMVTALAWSKRRFLDAVEAPIADYLDEMIRRNPVDNEAKETLDRALKMRQLVVTAKLLPVGQAIRQALLTTVVPVVSLVVSVYQSGALL